MKEAILVMMSLLLLTPLHATLTMNEVVIPDPSDGFASALAQLQAVFGRDAAATPLSTGIIYFYANGQRIAKIEHNKTFYFHNDHLGSATVVTDESGNVVEEKKYDPFGVELVGGSKIGYNSKELDRDTELNYYGTRHYGAEFGRFITPDTMKGKLANPQSLNLYAYTLNNPMKYIDRTGEQATASLQEQGGKKILQISGKLEWVNAEDARGRVAYSSVEFAGGSSGLLTRREGMVSLSMIGARGVRGPKEEVSLEVSGSQVEQNLRLRMEEAQAKDTPAAANIPPIAGAGSGRMGIALPAQNEGEAQASSGQYSTKALEPVKEYLTRDRLPDSSKALSAAGDVAKRAALGYVDFIDAVIGVAKGVTERRAAQVATQQGQRLKQRCGGCNVK
ncbi:hypothetical protein HY491_03640 [Candidatus Woesearchaeota archaeon]|nr:hypothetical protein [Candidatus Woesearchaeota archaeon]